MIKIYIIHYKKLHDRKRYLLNMFEKYNITNFEFIEHYDRDNLIENDTKLFNKNLQKVHMAICLSHFYAYNEISKDQQALILEDDVIIDNNFVDNLNDYVNKLPVDYDMVFIGDCCNLHIDKNKLKQNCVMYKRDTYKEYTTRCTSAYIVSKKCSINILNDLNIIKVLENEKKINDPIDWWLNYYFQNSYYNIYWAEPTIFLQGSESIYSKSY